MKFQGGREGKCRHFFMKANVQEEKMRPVSIRRVCDTPLYSVKPEVPKLSEKYFFMVNLC